MDGSSAAFVFAPFLIMIFFYLIFTAIGFFILYLVVRAAINNSKLSQSLETFRFEIAKLNDEIKSLKSPSVNKNDQE